MELAVSDKVAPAQGVLLLTATVGDATTLTLIVLVPVQPLVVAVTVYTPELATEAEVIAGFCAEDV